MNTSFLSQTKGLAHTGFHFNFVHPSFPRIRFPTCCASFGQQAGIGQGEKEINSRSIHIRETRASSFSPLAIPTTNKLRFPLGATQQKRVSTTCFPIGVAGTHSSFAVGCAKQEAVQGDSFETQKQTDLNRRYFIVGERRLSNYWWASVIFLGGFGFLLTGISSYLKYNILANAFNIFNIFKGLTSAYQAGEPLDDFTTNVTTLNNGEALIAFFPQGLLMCFYGSLGLLLSLYWWLLIYWDVGGGFNEFNKKEGFMRIFRWGYPGKNRRIDLVYPLQDIEAIRVEFKQAQGLLASEQTIYVRLLSSPAQATVGQISNSNLTDKTSATLTSSSTLPLSSKGLKEKSEIPLGGIGQPLTLKEIEKQASELANFLQVGLEGL